MENHTRTRTCLLIIVALIVLTPVLIFVGSCGMTMFAARFGPGIHTAFEDLSKELMTTPAP